MQISWYGQASFGIETESGLVIVTDPYDPEKAGYKPFPERADIVVISSDVDDFHCNEHLVPKKEGAEVINALTLAQNGGAHRSHGVEFTAVEALENLAHREQNPEQNGMYRFDVDGMSVGHMGDMGNPLSETQMDFFRGIDVLLALAGGYPTVELSELKRVIEETQPKLVIPMHFRTLRLKSSNALWISDFLALFPEEQVDFAYDSKAEVTKQSLPDSTRVLVLDYL